MDRIAGSVPSDKVIFDSAENVDVVSITSFPVWVMCPPSARRNWSRFESYLHRYVEPPPVDHSVIP